eukprot:scaffold180_cov311-Pinguiococcus_pyrenoidosus.AAC.29
MFHVSVSKASFGFGEKAKTPRSLVESAPSVLEWRRSIERGFQKSVSGFGGVAVRCQISDALLWQVASYELTTHRNA